MALQLFGGQSSSNRQQKMQQMERFEAQLQQLRLDVDALQSGSDVVPPRQGDRVGKRRRQSHDPAIPEVTTPSHDPSIEPLPEVPPPMVSMSEVRFTAQKKPLEVKGVSPRKCQSTASLRNANGAGDRLREGEQQSNIGLLSGMGYMHISKIPTTWMQ